MRAAPQLNFNLPAVGAELDARMARFQQLARYDFAHGRAPPIPIAAQQTGASYAYAYGAAPPPPPVSNGLAYAYGNGTSGGVSRSTAYDPSGVSPRQPIVFNNYVPQSAAAAAAPAVSRAAATAPALPISGAGSNNELDALTERWKRIVDVLDVERQLQEQQQKQRQNAASAQSSRRSSIAADDASAPAAAPATARRREPIEAENIKRVWGFGSTGTVNAKLKPLPKPKRNGAAAARPKSVAPASSAPSKAADSDDDGDGDARVINGPSAAAPAPAVNAGPVSPSKQRAEQHRQRIAAERAKLSATPEVREHAHRHAHQHDGSEEPHLHAVDNDAVAAVDPLLAPVVAIGADPPPVASAIKIRRTRAAIAAAASGGEWQRLRDMEIKNQEKRHDQQIAREKRAEFLALREQIRAAKRAAAPQPPGGPAPAPPPVIAVAPPPAPLPTHKAILRFDPPFHTSMHDAMGGGADSKHSAATNAAPPAAQSKPKAKAKAGGKSKSGRAPTQRFKIALGLEKKKPKKQKSKPKPKPKPAAAAGASGADTAAAAGPAPVQVVVQPNFFTPMRKPKHHTIHKPVDSPHVEPQRHRQHAHELASERERERERELAYEQELERVAAAEATAAAAAAQQPKSRHVVFAPSPDRTRTTVAHQTSADADAAPSRHAILAAAAGAVVPYQSGLPPRHPSDSEHSHRDAFDRAFENPPQSKPQPQSHVPPPQPITAFAGMSAPVEVDSSQPPAPKPARATQTEPDTFATAAPAAVAAAPVPAQTTAPVASQLWFAEMARYLDAMDDTQRTAAQHVLASIRPLPEPALAAATKSAGSSSPPRVVSPRTKATPTRTPSRNPPDSAKQSKSPKKEKASKLSGSRESFPASPIAKGARDRSRHAAATASTGSGSISLSASASSFKDALRASYSAFAGAVPAAANRTPAELVEAAMRGFEADPTARVRLPTRCPVDEKLFTAVMTDRDRNRRRALARDGDPELSADPNAPPQLNMVQINQLIADSLLEEMIESNTAEVSAIYDTWIDSVIKHEIGKF